MGICNPRLGKFFPFPSYARFMSTEIAESLLIQPLRRQAVMLLLGVSDRFWSFNQMLNRAQNYCIRKRVAIILYPYKYHTTSQMKVICIFLQHKLLRRCSNYYRFLWSLFICLLIFGDCMKRLSHFVQPYGLSPVWVMI